jgi:hypothetical protein
METHHVKPPGSADKLAIRCFKCDCCNDTWGVLLLHLADFDEDVYMEVTIRGEALNALAFDLQAEMQYPKPTVDGAGDMVNPPWWEEPNDEGD